MSGIRTITRAEALEVLLRRTRHEIACAVRGEERHHLPRLRELEDALLVELGLPPRPKSPAPRRRAEHVLDRLAELGVTSRQVKEWAVETGRLPAVVRGRISRQLVEAYASQHPKESA